MAAAGLAGKFEEFTVNAALRAVPLARPQVAHPRAGVAACRDAAEAEALTVPAADRAISAVRRDFRAGLTEYRQRAEAPALAAQVATIGRGRGGSHDELRQPIICHADSDVAVWSATDG